MDKDTKQALEIIKRGSDEIIPEDSFKKLLTSKKKLTVKAGFDPTSADLHLGHTVLINKLKAFQDLGHKVIFLIGDFTGLIGDPSGVNETRPNIDEKKLAENSKTYADQVFKILDKKKTKIKFNSSWFKKMKPDEFIKLSSIMTVARMLERDDFKKRYENNKPISLHEFLYPLLQAQDSVEIKADVELGGTDQKFNLLLGRKLQEDHNIKPQVCIMMPILEGLDGVKKMSKSLDNYISISDEPNDMFGKVMSISDDLMWRYYDLLSFKNYEDIASVKQMCSQDKFNPRDAKIDLAHEFVERFHGQDKADKAKSNFISRFQNKNITDDIPLIELKTVGELRIIDLIINNLKVIKSTSEVRRLISQNAIKIDSKPITTIDYDCSTDSEFLLQIGKKKAYKILLRP